MSCSLVVSQILEELLSREDDIDFQTNLLCKIIPVLLDFLLINYRKIHRASTETCLF